MKASRMKEIALKRRSELEEICKSAYIDPDISTAPEKAIALIDSGIFFFPLGKFLMYAPENCHNLLTIVQNKKYRTKVVLFLPIRLQKIPNNTSLISLWRGRHMMELMRLFYSEELCLWMFWKKPIYNFVILSFSISLLR